MTVTPVNLLRIFSADIRSSARTSFPHCPRWLHGFSRTRPASPIRLSWFHEMRRGLRH